MSTNHNVLEHDGRCRQGVKRDRMTVCQVLLETRKTAILEMVTRRAQYLREAIGALPMEFLV